MIRKANKKDIDTIARFQTLMAEETEGLTLDRETVTKGVSSVFEDPAKGFYLVNEQDGIIIACLMITPEWSDWRSQTIWWIQSLYVEPVWRKKGIFRELYQYLKELISGDDSAGGIRLYVDKTNSRAIKAYQALGMNGEHYQMFEDMKT